MLNYLQNGTMKKLQHHLDISMIIEQNVLELKIPMHNTILHTKMLHKHITDTSIMHRCDISQKRPSNYTYIFFLIHSVFTMKPISYDIFMQWCCDAFAKAGQSGLAMAALNDPTQ